MSEIDLTNGMDALLEHTSQGDQFDHIIISDSNSVFIQHILENKNIASVFHQIFTNPAKFIENGLLTLKGYHEQDWCTLSSVNMCKGHILKSFIQDRKKESVEYSHVLYVGDGHNDLCPALTLRSNDFLFPRINFKLNKLVNDVVENDEPVSKNSLKAKVVPWHSGLDILQCIKSYVKI